MLSRLTYNTELVADAATDSLTVADPRLAAILFNVGYLFWHQLAAGMFAMLAAPAIAWLMRNVNSRFRRYSTRIQNSMGDVTRVAKEALDAHRVVKVFNAQEHIARAVRRRQRAQPPLQHAAAVGARQQQPDRAADRGRRAWPACCTWPIARSPAAR